MVIIDEMQRETVHNYEVQIMSHFRAVNVKRKKQK